LFSVRAALATATLRRYNDANAKRKKTEINMDRLNKYLAHAGLGSRRQCEDLIRAGRVSIDGAVVKELATRVGPEQEVHVDGEPIQAEKFVYWAVNKPRGYLCTNRDPSGRPLALDLVPHITQRVYTVGRLDEDSEGLLLLTNDGDLAHRLMHPRFGVEKAYLVLVAGSPTSEDLQKLLDGIWLAEGHVKARSVKRLKKHFNSTWMRIVLAEGKNREIRRMLAKLDHKVLRLKRISIGPIELDRLAVGKSRALSTREIKILKRLAAKVDPVETEAE
jgi:23S rRNA pseudouridine2605 synthase